MSFLFAHISWMPEYSGKSSERIFSTHGWVLKNGDGHERSNYNAINGHLYGYVPVREKTVSETPGEINISRLGAQKTQNVIDDITVIWFANHPLEPQSAYVVGWYRNAKVFRFLQFEGNREYRILCHSSNATLLNEAVRKFPIPHIRSAEGQKLGFGYGQSSIWYADENTDEFLKEIENYIDSVDIGASRKNVFQVDKIGDAIDDLDDFAFGNETPHRRKFSGSFIVRDNKIRMQVIKRANGKCEYCGQLGFKKKTDGSNFVEAHHIINLAEQGPDTLDNVIALCPNHHREAHFGEGWEQLEAEFKTKLAKLRGKK